jgi:hypothetical protein
MTRSGDDVRGQARKANFSALARSSPGRIGPFGTANCLHFAEISLFARLGSERIGSRSFGAREVLLQGSYYEVSLALVGVVSLAFFYYTI